MDAVAKRVRVYFDDFRVLKYIDSDFKKQVIKIREYFGFNQSVKLIVFNDIEELITHIGISVPVWVIGTNIENNILMVDYSKWTKKNIGNFGQTVIHELIHIIINHVGFGICPLWLDEGLALYLSGQYKLFKHEETITRVEISKIDVYKLSYENSYFYNICALIIEQLVSDFGVEYIINKIHPKKVYEEDSVLGTKAMKDLIETLG